jgi:mannose-6-phosphate isomerase-like protein (cupin superfamily)
MFSAGIYRLMAGEADEQTPHHEDEIYYVLSGRADLEVAGERQRVEVLVVFAPPESG